MRGVVLAVVVIVAEGVVARANGEVYANCALRRFSHFTSDIFKVRTRSQTHTDNVILDNSSSSRYIWFNTLRECVFVCSLAWSVLSRKGANDRAHTATIDNVNTHAQTQKHVHDHNNGRLVPRTIERVRGSCGLVWRAHCTAAISVVRFSRLPGALWIVPRTDGGVAGGGLWWCCALMCKQAQVSLLCRVYVNGRFALARARVRAFSFAFCVLSACLCVCVLCCANSTSSFQQVVIHAPELIVCCGAVVNRRAQTRAFVCLSVCVVADVAVSGCLCSVRCVERAGCWWCRFQSPRVCFAFVLDFLGRRWSLIVQLRAFSLRTPCARIIGVFSVIVVFFFVQLIRNLVLSCNIYAD